VKPRDDFFTYANGNWMKSAKIPDEYPIWGTTWELRDRTWQVLREILEESARRSDWPAGSVRQKVGDFFAGGMDEAAIERAGHKPLSSHFAGIAAISTPGELAAALGRLRHGARQGREAYGLVDSFAARRCLSLIVPRARIRAET
jgi:putative endopeptidase